MSLNKGGIFKNKSKRIIMNKGWYIFTRNSFLLKFCSKAAYPTECCVYKGKKNTECKMSEEKNLKE